MAVGKGWAAVLVVAMTLNVSGRIAAEEVAPSPFPFMQQPEWLGHKYVNGRDWKELDALVESLAASGERTVDGRSQLAMLIGGIDRLFDDQAEDKDSDYRARIAQYDGQFPQSPLPPILAAMYVHSTAWRARGGGYSSTVAPEGWALFRERNATAWKMMQAAKARSARLPTWYEKAIHIGRDANVSGEELMAIFHEGIERFPGYHPIYFMATGLFAPRWGGNYEDADAFITAQVAAKTNPEGEALYTRLYWSLDQYGGGDSDFFEESKVNWSRMRTGFELLMKAFPDSAWNQANFASFACRAGDGPTYVKLRPQVVAFQFAKAATVGISIDVCDARFLQKT